MADLGGLGGGVVVGGFGTPLSLKSRRTLSFSELSNFTLRSARSKLQVHPHLLDHLTPRRCRTLWQGCRSHCPQHGFVLRRLRDLPAGRHPSSGTRHIGEARRKLEVQAGAKSLEATTMTPASRGTSSKAKWPASSFALSMEDASPGDSPAAPLRDMAASN